MTNIIGNKQNQNIPDKTRKLQKPKLGFGFVPAHFQFIVKTPTSTQHIPKTTSTDVGFDMNMTLRPPHHHHHRNSTLTCENLQGSVN